MRHFAAILILCLIAACRTTPSGIAIEGVVTLDGKPVPGATVTLSNGRIAISDARGRVVFAKLKAGTYTLRAELEGFQPSTRNITLFSPASVRVELPMQLSVAINGAPSHDSLFMVEGLVVNENLRGQVSAEYGGLVSAPEPEVPQPEPGPIAEHGFTETHKQPVTTFAIDVDQASYTNVRGMLADGMLPPPEAVRVEEMINYFTYRYAQPVDGSPFSIATEVAGCPWNAKNRLLRIAIQGRSLDEWRMAPNNLVFLLDVSGSMDSLERLPLIQSAFHVLVDQLRAEDRVSIVVYAGAAGLVLPPTSGADKKAILAALNSLHAGGSTAGGEGIQLAYKVARDTFLANGNNRVILATDGDFNVGITSIEDMQKLIEEERKSGVFLTTIGVGTAHGDAMLETLADKGNGAYYYFDNIAEAKNVFQRQLAGTLVTIAKDVKVQLEFDPALVASYRQIGYENRALANEDFDDDTKDAGELGAGHSVTALYEIVPAAQATGRVATLELRYKEPKSDVSKLVSVAANDEGKSAYAASPDMQFATAVAEFAMLLRNSPHRGTATYADALHLARLAQGEDLDGQRAELISLLDTARALSGEGGQ